MCRLQILGDRETTTKRNRHSDDVCWSECCFGTMDDYLRNRSTAGSDRLGPERVPAMLKGLDRTKVRLERILSGSIGNAVVTVEWGIPANPSSAADANVSQFHNQTTTGARDKLINRAEADDEPQSEILMYQSLPQNGSVPFFYDSATPASAALVSIPNSLNKHLAFAPTTDNNDGTIRFRIPNASTKWQFFPKPGAALSGYNVFEAVVLHETVHLLGFESVADNQTSPVSLSSWDLFRFNDADIPITAALFASRARELRPTQEATAITQLSSAAKAYKLARGTRPGGDGAQASHWRSYLRLNPQTPIGMMNPGATAALYEILSGRFYTRADVEALDVIGWNINPDLVPFADAGSVTLMSPLASAQIPQGTAITFTWGPTPANLIPDGLSVLVYPGTQIVDDSPVRVFDQLPAGTTSVTLASTSALPPGEYVWGVVASTYARDVASEERRFTIVAACYANCDGSTTVPVLSPADYSCFLAKYRDGDPYANCDGSTQVPVLTPADFSCFLAAYRAGCN